ncbi:sialidase family protein [Nafulsella turpanensis]|uniref:hypothetical protein n=1 Tax=Nafulsella turpanensis TaxID=1265690 RepID=UPI0003468E16|nr:hypothetical protein [Nafulsella turpanensis]
MVKKNKIIVAGLVLMLSNCGPAEEGKNEQVTEIAEPQLEFREIPVPSGVNSFFPRLAETEKNKGLLLSWYEGKEEDSMRLYTASLGEDWSEPALVAEGENWFVNWADFPEVSTFGEGRKAISYLQKNGEGLFAYEIRLKLYNPATGKWSESIVPHLDGVEAEHGFVSMAPMEENTLGMVWLDGRKYGASSHNGHGGHGSAEMTMRFARISPDGDLLAQNELDGRTCDCCQTGLAATADGLVAVYRDRSAEEVRDIAFMRYEKGEWSEPQVLFKDNWTIKGCPVNGPAIDAEGEAVAVAWFTAADGKQQVKLIRSEDGGESWGDPVLVDNDEPEGRVGVSLLPDGSTAVSWLAKEGKLNVKRIAAEGILMDSTTVTTLENSRSSGFPQMVHQNGSLYVAWTVTGEEEQLKMAKAEL